MPAGPAGQERPRYARVLSPADDSTVYDLALTLVVRVMFFAIFVTQAALGAATFWRLLAAAAALVWVYFIVDSLRRIQAARASTRRS